MYVLLRRLIVVFVVLAVPAALLSVWFDERRWGAFLDSDDSYIVGFIVGCHGLVSAAVYTSLETVAFTKSRRWIIYWLLVVLWCGVLLAIRTETSADINYLAAVIGVIAAVVAAIVCKLFHSPTSL